MGLGVDKNKVAQLTFTATKIRRSALEMVYQATSGHLGGSFSLCEILAVLYFDEMSVDPKEPQNPQRDRFVLSKGHCTPALYSALALKGYFETEALKSFRDINSFLSGHAEMHHVPGVDMSTGSLGQGLSVATGMALAGKVDQKDYRVYAVVGDGEIQEGQIWEASMLAGNYKLDNLCVIVDNNNIQIDGTIEEIMSPYPINDKFKAFGFNVIHCDGHNIESISDALKKASSFKGMPSVIIAKTIKGKGVSFMENSNEWHGNDPNKEQYEKAADELDEAMKIAEEEVKRYE